MTRFSDEPFIQVGMLLTVLIPKFQAMLVFYDVADEALSELQEKTKWYDERLDRYENKQRMKEFGGVLYAQRNLLKELEIMGLAKTVEDMIVEVKEITGVDFNIWKNDELALPYHHDVRLVRHLNNLIKHNNGRFASPPGSKAAEWARENLKVNSSMTVHDFPLDVRRHIYYTFEFLQALVSHATGVATARIRATYETFQDVLLPELWQTRALRTDE